MKIFYDPFEFAHTVKPITDFIRLAEMNFSAQSAYGYFCSMRVPDLLHFCSLHSQYHIISVLSKGIAVNHYHPSGGRFRLAEGDPNPMYTCDFRPIAEATFSKFGDCKAPETSTVPTGQSQINLRFLKEPGEFSKRVKMVYDFVLLYEAGLTSMSVGGTFFSWDMPELWEFCLENSRYHIVSIIRDLIYVNHYDPSANLFKLAEGDTNPEYAQDGMPLVKFAFSRLFKQE